MVGQIGVREQQRQPLSSDMTKHDAGTDSRHASVAHPDGPRSRHVAATTCPRTVTLARDAPTVSRSLGFGTLIIPLAIARQIALMDERTTILLFTNWSLGMEPGY